MASLSVSSSTILFAQQTETSQKWINKHPVDFAIGNFSVGVPFSKIFNKPTYALITLGTEFYYNNKQHFRVYQTARVGGYYNKYNTSSLFVHTEIGLRYTYKVRFFADADLGIGYSQLFRPGAIYKLNNDRNYHQVRDWGKPSLMADYTLSIGYIIVKSQKNTIAVFLRYGNYVQLFYNPDIPFLPQNSFQIGTRFLIHQKHR